VSADGDAAGAGVAGGSMAGGGEGMDRTDRSTALKATQTDCPENNKNQMREIAEKVMVSKWVGYERVNERDVDLLEGPLLGECAFLEIPPVVS